MSLYLYMVVIYLACHPSFNFLIYRVSSQALFAQLPALDLSGFGGVVEGTPWRALKACCVSARVIFCDSN